jgi:hypothetical protein
MFALEEVTLNSHETLAALRKHLEALNNRHYRNPSERSAPLSFEASEICRSSPYFSCHSSRCLLMAFVPQEFRSAAVPCRHIALNESGETLDMLYRTSTNEGTEEAARKWLASAIRKLESETGEQRRAA